MPNVPIPSNVVPGPEVLLKEVPYRGHPRLILLGVTPSEV